ncbi:MAG: hypothetical protein SH850_24450, partial [Planctomycetaceae bacterium]|nr:hypothetical protein [Planctomycetaceae bacterium]
PQSGAADKLKVLAAIAGLIVVVCGLGWLMSSIGGLFDSPNSMVVTPVGLPPTTPLDPNAAGQAAVAGGVAPGTELSNNAPTIAPVFGGPNGTQSGPLTAGSPANALNPPVNPGVSPGSAIPGVTPGVSVQQPAIKLPDDPTKRPDVLDKPVEPPKLPVWTVGLGNASATHFSSLNEALSKAAGQSVVIKLLGSGPYLLSNAAPLRSPQLHLVSDGQTSPLIVLTNSADGSPGRLHVVGDLTLDGVHLVIDRQASSVADPVAMITVENGNLTLRQSSLTAIQTGSAPLSAISVKGSAHPPRVWLSQTAIRGEIDVGLDLIAPSVAALVQDSLIAVGGGSIIRLRGEGAAQSRTDPIRLIRSFSSTLVCRGSLLDVTADKDLEAPPETHVVLADTVCSTGEGDGPQILLNAAGWLQSRLRETVTWTNSNSAILGYETLIDLGAASSFKAADAEGWKSFWRRSVEPHEFTALEWPTGVAQLSVANPSDFGRDAIPTATRTVGVRGVMPGAPGERLTVPESVFPERMAALAKRTGFAATPWATGAPVKFDLRGKMDLGVFLAKGDWPDRAVIEASGYGLCNMTPVTLSGRSVKIVFRQTDPDKPLRLVVKEPAKPADGLFQVRDGSLELEGLRWQVLEVKPSTPKWLVSAVDSRVVIRDCELLGPEAATTPFEGVIRFEATAEQANRPQLGLFDSYLHAPGTLIRVEASDAGVFLNNCVLAARGVAIDSRPRAIGERLPLTFDLTNCTLSAQNTVVRATGATSLSGPAAWPSRWFVDNCVFAPPIELRAGDASTPTVLTFVGPVVERREIEWWGRSNGAAREIKYWLRPEGSLPAADKSNHDAWVKT